MYNSCPGRYGLLYHAGAADGSVKVWDRRNLSTALHSFRPHNKPIMRVEWAPYKKGEALTHAPHYRGPLLSCPVAPAKLPCTHALLLFWADSTFCVGEFCWSSISTCLRVLNPKQRLQKEVWSCAGVFASGGEDQLIAVWDLERTGETSAAVAGGASADEEQQPALPHQLMFQHAGHRSQVISRSSEHPPRDPFSHVS